MHANGFIDDGMNPTVGYTTASRCACPLDSLHPPGAHGSTCDDGPQSGVKDWLDHGCLEIDENQEDFGLTPHHRDVQREPILLNDSAPHLTLGVQGTVSSDDFHTPVHSYLSQRFNEVSMSDGAQYHFSYTDPSMGQMHYVTVCDKGLQLTKGQTRHAQLHPETHHAFCFDESEIVIVDGIFSKLTSGALSFEVRFHLYT